MATIHELNNEQAYEAEIGECVGVTGYHHWFFLSALADALSLEFRAYAIESGGDRLGVVPMLLRRTGPFATVNFLPVGGIGPVIRGAALRAGRLADLLRGAEPVLRRHRAVAARWAFSPALRLPSATLDIPASPCPTASPTKSASGSPSRWTPFTTVAPGALPPITWPPLRC